MSIVVKSVKEAWNRVNQIFPTDYEKDEQCSKRAGYPIYRSTDENHYYDYICDLGCRLEVNLDSSKFPSVNVFIQKDEPSENLYPSKEEIKVAASEKFTFEPKQVTLIRFHVMGYEFEREEDRRVYSLMQRQSPVARGMIATDLAVSYCEDKGIEWGCISVIRISEYHNSKRDGEGHFVIEAIVTKRVDK